MDSYCFREAVDVVEADVSFTSFNLTHIRTVEFGTMGQFLLAQPLLDSKRAHATAKRGSLRELLGSYGRHYSTVGE